VCHFCRCNPAKHPKRSDAILRGDWHCDSLSSKERLENSHSLCLSHSISTFLSATRATTTGRGISPSSRPASRKNTVTLLAERNSGSSSRKTRSADAHGRLPDSRRAIFIATLWAGASWHASGLRLAGLGISPCRSSLQRHIALWQSWRPKKGDFHLLPAATTCKGLRLLAQAAEPARKRSERIPWLALSIFHHKFLRSAKPATNALGNHWFARAAL
jgi:hypothetical protein